MYLLGLASFSDKHVMAILGIFVFIYEVRLGYFKGVRQYLASFSIRSYGALILWLILVTILAIFLDSALLQWVQAQTSSWADWTVNFGSDLGKRVNGWIIMMIFYFGALALRSAKWRDLIFSAIASSFFTVVIVSLCKILFLRTRPVGDEGPFAFFNYNYFFQDGSLHRSFSSGDVGVVAGASAYLFFAAKNYWWRWLFFLLPLTTAFARVSLDKHWPSDTIFSIGIGLIFAKFVWNFRKDIIGSQQK